MISSPAPLARPANTPTVSLSSVSPDELQMPSETPPDSRVLIIRNPDRTWVPGGVGSLPPHCSLGMPYALAAALAVELNRNSMNDLSRASSWYVVISRQNKAGYAVMRVLRSANWVPQDEFDIPPDASEPTFNCGARRDVHEFNRRELQMGRSPEFWAIHIKPLRKESTGHVELNVTWDQTRVIRFNGQRDVHVVVQGVSSDREALRKFQDAASLLLQQ